MSFLSLSSSLTRDSFSFLPLFSLFFSPFSLGGTFYSDLSLSNRSIGLTLANARLVENLRTIYDIVARRGSTRTT